MPGNNGIMRFIIQLIEAFKRTINYLKSYFVMEPEKQRRTISIDSIKSMLSNLRIPSAFPIARITGLSFVMMLMATQAFANDLLPGVDWTSPENWFGSAEAIYGLIVMLGGYATKWIPGINKITSTTYRIVAFAIIVGVAFALFGTSVIGMVLAYASSTSIYEVVLSALFGKTPNENHEEPETTEG